MSKLLKSAAVSAALLSASPVIADQTHWWLLARSARGAQEVCIDRWKDGLHMQTPAEQYEDLKSYKDRNPGIEEEDTEFWLDQAAGTHVHRVKVIWWQDGQKMALYYFRTLEECRVIAKANSLMADLEDRKLEKYR